MPGNSAGLPRQINQVKGNWAGKTSIPDGWNHMCKGPEASMSRASQNTRGFTAPRKSGDARVKPKLDTGTRTYVPHLGLAP